MNIVKEKYQKVQGYYDHIINQEEIWDNPPNTFPVYTTKQKIKDQILLNAKKYSLDNMKITQDDLERIR